jgi:mRNA-degrading endonuclease RelE of RelBE toxin-antitoxin system
MAAGENPFRVLSTPPYERDLRKVTHGRPSVVEAITEMQEILGQDPHNRSGQHKIKKLAGYKVGEGQWRIRWKEYRLRYDIVGNDVVLIFLSPPEGCLLAGVSKSEAYREMQRGK